MRITHLQTNFSASCSGQENRQRNAVPSMLRRRRAPVALLLVREDFAKVAHVEPATARGALDEMLPLVLRFAAARWP